MEKKAKVGLLILISMFVLNLVNEIWLNSLTIIYIGSAFVGAYGLLLMFPAPKNEEVKEGKTHEQ